MTKYFHVQHNTVGRALIVSELQGLCIISFILADRVRQECMNLKFSDTINSVAIQDLKLSI